MNEVNYISVLRTVLAGLPPTVLPIPTAERANFFRGNYTNMACASR